MDGTHWQVADVSVQVILTLHLWWLLHNFLLPSTKEVRIMVSQVIVVVTALLLYGGMPVAWMTAWTKLLQASVLYFGPS